MFMSVRYEFELSRLEATLPMRAAAAPQPQPERPGATPGEGVGPAGGAAPRDDSSDESDALSPPASPSHLLHDSTR